MPVKGFVEPRHIPTFGRQSRTPDSSDKLRKVLDEERNSRLTQWIRFTLGLAPRIHIHTLRVVDAIIII